MVPADALWLCAALAAIVPLGMWLTKLLPLPAETLWFALGLVASIGARFGDATALDALDWLPPTLWSVVLPLFVFVRAFRIDRRALGFHLFPVVAITVLAVGTGGAAMAATLTQFVPGAIPWTAAVILGVSLAAIDAGAVTTTLGRLVPRGVPILLGGEAVFAGAIAYALIDVALGMHARAEPADAPMLLERFAIQFGAGAAIGGLLGWLAIALARFATKDVLPAALVAGLALCAHQVAQALGVSGVAACLVAGLAAGAATDPNAAPRISTALSTAIRGALFALAGAWLPSVASAAPPAVLALAVAAMVCARLATVHALTWTVARLAKMGLTRRERWLLCAFSARGANTIGLVLALGASAHWVPVVRSIALAVVAFDLLVTASASRPLARRFGNPPFGPPGTRLAAIEPRSPI